MEQHPIAGERNKSAKLREYEVLEILGSTEFLRTLAERYGVSIVTIHQIRTGKRWRYLQ